MVTKWLFSSFLSHLGDEGMASFQKGQGEARGGHQTEGCATGAEDCQVAFCAACVQAA